MGKTAREPISREDGSGGKITAELAKHMDLSWTPQRPECSSCKPSAGEAETEDPRVVRSSNSMRLSYWKSSTADLRHMPTRIHVQINTYTSRVGWEEREITCTLNWPICFQT